EVAGSLDGFALAARVRVGLDEDLGPAVGVRNLRVRRRRKQDPDRQRERRDRERARPAIASFSLSIWILLAPSAHAQVADADGRPEVFVKADPYTGGEREAVERAGYF